MKRLLLAALVPIVAQAQGATLFRNARVFDGVRVQAATDVLIKLTAVVPAGAAGTAKALEVKGTLALGAAFGWSGVMFSPGARPMAPANLSSKRDIVFSARGDGRQYQLMLFSQRLGFMPASRPFIAGPEWKEIVLPFSTFAGTDGGDVMGLVFAATGTPGVFAFQIDEIRLR